MTYQLTSTDGRDLREICGKISRMPFTWFCVGWQPIGLSGEGRMAQIVHVKDGDSGTVEVYDDCAYVTGEGLARKLMAQFGLRCGPLEGEK